MTPFRMVSIASVAFGLRLLLAWEIPFGSSPGGDPNRAPDEAGHFSVVKELSRGHVRHWPEDGPTYSYANYLPTNYVAQAATTRLLAPFSRRLEECVRFPSADPSYRGILGARAGSILLGVVACLLLSAAAERATGSRQAGWAAGMAAAVYPQVAFVTSYVNGDALTFAAGSFLALALARWARSGEGAKGLPAVGAAVGLVLLGKPYGYSLVVPTVVWVGWAVWRRTEETRGAAFRSFALLALVGGPPLLFNAIRNRGDVFGSAALKGVLKTFGREPSLVPNTPDAWSIFQREFGRSSFGLFGNMDIPLHPAWYAGALVLLVVGLVWMAAALRTASALAWRGVGWGTGALVTNLALVGYMSWTVDFQAQGRYALPSIFFVVLVVVTGPMTTGPGRPGGRWWTVLTLAFLSGAALAMVRAIWLLPFGP